MKNLKPVSKNQKGVVDHTFIIIAFIVIIGIIGTYILARSNAASKCTKETFQKGSSGVCVKDIQTMLNGLVAAHDVYPSSSYYSSYYGSTLSVNSEYDSLTTGQVGYFQTTKGMLDDGIVGLSTWPKLCSAVNNIPIISPVGLNGTNLKLLNEISSASTAASKVGC